MANEVSATHLLPPVMGGGIDPVLFQLLQNDGALFSWQLLTSLFMRFHFQMPDFSLPFGAQQFHLLPHISPANKHGFASFVKRFEENASFRDLLQTKNTQENSSSSQGKSPYQGLWAQAKEIVKNIAIVKTLLQAADPATAMQEGMDTAEKPSASQSPRIDELIQDAKLVSTTLHGEESLRDSLDALMEGVDSLQDLALGVLQEGEASSSSGEDAPQSHFEAAKEGRRKLEEKSFAFKELVQQALSESSSSARLFLFQKASSLQRDVESLLENLFKQAALSLHQQAKNSPNRGTSFTQTASFSRDLDRGTSFSRDSGTSFTQTASFSRDLAPLPKPLPPAHPMFNPFAKERPLGSNPETESGSLLKTLFSKAAPHQAGAAAQTNADTKPPFSFVVPYQASSKGENRKFSQVKNKRGEQEKDQEGQEEEQDISYQN